MKMLAAARNKVLQLLQSAAVILLPDVNPTNGLPLDVFVPVILLDEPYTERPTQKLKRYTGMLAACSS